MSTSTASAAAGFFRRKAGSGVGGADTAASDHNYPSHVVGPVTRSSSGGILFQPTPAPTVLSHNHAHSKPFKASPATCASSSASRFSQLVSFPRIIGDRSTRLSPNNKSDSSFSSSLSPSKSCSLGTLSLSRSEFDHPSITSPIARKSPRLPLSISTSNLKQRYLGTSPFSAPLLRPHDKQQPAPSSSSSVSSSSPKKAVQLSHSQSLKGPSASNNNSSSSSSTSPCLLTVAEKHLSKHALHPAFLAKYSLNEELGCGGFGFVCSAFTRTHLHYHHQQFDIYNSNHHHHNAVCTNGSTTCPVAEASGYSLPTTTQESNGLIGGLATHHHHPSSHRQGYSGEVAVKFIFKDKVPEKGWAHDPALGVIPLEIYLLRQMKHDNIVGFIDFFEDDQFFYLVTELHGTPWTDSSNTNINGCGDASDVTSSSSPTSLAPLSASSSLSLPRCSSTKSSLLSSVSTLLSVDQQHQCNPVMVSTSASSNSISSFSSPLTASSSSSRLSLSRPFSSEIINAQPQTQPRSYLRRRSSCDLFECIEQHSHLSEQLAKKIFRQIISAIHYMHGLGIVHRDIKDENILVDSNFVVKLIDFGSATLIMDDKTGEEKIFSRFLGTIQYASPEILRGEKYHGPEAEVWALGCCLYIMLTGQVPFDSPVQAMGQRYTEPTNCVLSPQCRSLLDMMLTKQAAKRAKIIDIADHEWLRC